MRNQFHCICVMNVNVYLTKECFHVQTQNFVISEETVRTYGILRPTHALAEVRN
jgi:hypothetical protein